MLDPSYKVVIDLTKPRYPKAEIEIWNIDALIYPSDNIITTMITACTSGNISLEDSKKIILKLIDAAISEHLLKKISRLQIGDKKEYENAILEMLRTEVHGYVLISGNGISNTRLIALTEVLGTRNLELVNVDYRTETRTSLALLAEFNRSELDQYTNEQFTFDPDYPYWVFLGKREDIDIPTFGNDKHHHPVLPNNDYLVLPKSFLKKCCAMNGLKKITNNEYTLNVELTETNYANRFGIDVKTLSGRIIFGDSIDAIRDRLDYHREQGIYTDCYIGGYSVDVQGFLYEVARIINNSNKYAPVGMPDDSLLDHQAFTIIDPSKLKFESNSRIVNTDRDYNGCIKVIDLSSGFIEVFGACEPHHFYKMPKGCRDDIETAYVHWLRPNGVSPDKDNRYRVEHMSALCHVKY